MAYTFASATILLLLITDPFGNIPIFVNALRGVAPERRMRVILREVLIAFLLLLAFMFVLNMVGALVLLPALAHFLLPAPAAVDSFKHTITTTGKAS